MLGKRRLGSDQRCQVRRVSQLCSAADFHGQGCVCDEVMVHVILVTSATSRTRRRTSLALDAAKSMPACASCVAWATVAGARLVGLLLPFLLPLRLLLLLPLPWCSPDRLSTQPPPSPPSREQAPHLGLPLWRPNHPRILTSSYSSLPLPLTFEFILPRITTCHRGLPANNCST